MTKYRIFKVAGNGDSFCHELEATSERAALRKYRKTCTSSGAYWLEEFLGDWILRTSFGAQFIAVKQRYGDEEFLRGKIFRGCKTVRRGL